MAVFTQNYNIGNAVTPTNGNTGGTAGDAITVNAPGANTTLTALTAASAEASGQGLRVVGVSGETGSHQWSKTAASTFTFRIYGYANSAVRPDGSYCVARLRTATSANVCKLTRNASGVWGIINAAGVGVHNLNSNAEPANGWYCFRLYGTVGAGATFSADMWRMSDGVQIGSTFTSAAGAAGTVNASIAQWGRPEGTSNITAQDLDLPAFDIGTATPIALYSAPSNFPPTVSLASASPNLYPGESSLITATASDPDGTIASHSWSTDLGTLSGSGSTRTLFSPARSTDAAATVSDMVTDNLGATATGTVQVTLKASGHRLCTGTGGYSDTYSDTYNDDAGGASAPAIRKLFT